MTYILYIHKTNNRLVTEIPLKLFDLIARDDHPEYM